MSRKIRAANRAIDIAGGAADLSRKLLAPGYSHDDFRRMQHRIAKWKLNGVAPYWVLAVERVTGVSRHDLAPNLYPNETEAA